MATVHNPLAAREPWDLVAAGYAAEMGLVMEPFADRAIELANPPPDGRVVDVASGPGTLALRIAPRVAEVHAVDFSEAMLAELRRCAAERGIHNVQARQGDGQDLPFAADTFVAGFSMFGLMFFPDRARGFSELRRVLRPGGVAVVSSWAPASDSSVMRLMFGAVRAIEPSVKAPEANLLSLESEGRFEQELREAGFVDVSVVPHVHTLEAPSSPAALWESFARGSAPLVLLRQRLGEAAWAERSPEALAYVARAIPDALPLTTKALLGRGRKAG